MGSALSPRACDGQGVEAMRYGQAESSEQMTFLAAEQTTKPKQASIPIYKVTLVREGRVSCYAQQIRSSADASTLLHTYLANVDREHFVIILLNQKNRVVGSSGGRKLSIRYVEIHLYRMNTLQNGIPVRRTQIREASIWICSLANSAARPSATAPPRAPPTADLRTRPRR